MELYIRREKTKSEHTKGHMRSPNTALFEELIWLCPELTKARNCVRMIMAASGLLDPNVNKMQRKTKIDKAQ